MMNLKKVILTAIVIAGIVGITIAICASVSSPLVDVADYAAMPIRGSCP